MCEYPIKIPTLMEAGRDTQVEKRELATTEASEVSFTFISGARYRSRYQSFLRYCPTIFSHIIYFVAYIKVPITTLKDK